MTHGEIERLIEEVALQREYARSLKRERDDAVEILQRLLECQRTCPTILRFAVSAKEILKDAGRWGK